jgi:predicted RNase H-like nuclease
LQWVRITSPSRIWLAPNPAIRSTACCEDRTNWSARPITAARASSVSVVPSSPAMTMCTAFGSETAVGRVATRVAAAVSISCRNAAYDGLLSVPAWSRSASAAARAIRPAPRISIFFIFSAVSDTIIAISD